MTSTPYYPEPSPVFDIAYDEWFTVCPECGMSSLRAAIEEWGRCSTCQLKLLFKAGDNVAAVGVGYQLP